MAEVSFYGSTKIEIVLILGSKTREKSSKKTVRDLKELRTKCVCDWNERQQCCCREPQQKWSFHAIFNYSVRITSLLRKMLQDYSNDFRHRVIG